MSRLPPARALLLFHGITGILRRALDDKRDEERRNLAHEKVSQMAGLGDFFTSFMSDPAIGNLFFGDFFRTGSRRKGPAKPGDPPA